MMGMYRVLSASFTFKELSERFSQSTRRNANAGFQSSSNLQSSPATIAFNGRNPINKLQLAKFGAINRVQMVFATLQFV